LKGENIVVQIFLVKMNGQPWPKDGKFVSLNHVLTALRKSLVKSIQP